LRLSFLLAPPSTQSPNLLPQAWLDRLAACARTSPSPPVALLPAAWASSPALARLVACGGADKANAPLRAARLCPTVADPQSPQSATEAALRLAHELFCALDAGQGGGSPAAAAAASAALEEAASPEAAEEVLSALAAAVVATMGGDSDNSSSDDLAIRLARALLAAPAGKRNLAALLRAAVASSSSASSSAFLSPEETRALRALLLGSP
jgi:hypothetical protein